MTSFTHNSGTNPVTIMYYTYGWTVWLHYTYGRTVWCLSVAQEQLHYTYGRTVLECLWCVLPFVVISLQVDTIMLWGLWDVCFLGISNFFFFSHCHIASLLLFLWALVQFVVISPRFVSFRDI